MKRFVLLFVLQLAYLFSFAQLNGDGYYRIRNVGSQRYITVTDDKGSVNISSTSADLGAVKMFKSFSNVVSDPGTVLYINEVSGLYRFESQGTDTHEIIGYDLKLKQKADGSYLAYQEESFIRMYLCDARKEDTEDGVLSTKSDNTNYRDWEILPLSSSSDNYFGITSEFSYGGAYYSTLYASFPFTFASSGMTAYYINKVENGVAVISEVPNNMVPGSMPVIIKATSAEPANNRLNIADHSATKPVDNKLGGVYFHNTSKAHNNLTPYNPETMRVLGLTSKGKLGFIKADIEYLPANKAYLVVPAGSPDELEVMTKEEYNVYQNQTFIVVATASEGGSVTGSGTYKLNTLVTLTATPSEGYSFVGWSDGTNINPYAFKVAKDVSLVAKFATNEYTLTYMVDGQVYATESLEYGAPVVLKDAPVKDGYIFDGWTDAPTTMPAHDVVVTANYADGISGVDSDRLVDVYTLQGVRVKSQVPVSELQRELPRGIYIIDGRVWLIK